MAGTNRSAGASQGALIEIDQVTRRFLNPKGVAFTALKDVALTIQPGTFCAIVGPTGCGKSTTLGMVAGLDKPSGGQVRIDGKPVNGVQDGTSFMFQADALMPWKTVLGNVALGPILKGVKKKDAEDKARDWIRRVGLSGFEDHHPHQLSGGMRKRVGMAAALINEPRILLMDEPFGALDVQTKAIMQTELITLWEQLRATVLFITHDLDEAVALADQVAVMTSGPGSIKAVYDIDLPRPRGAVQELRYDPTFLETQQHIWGSLREEVERTYARTAVAS